MSHGVRSVDAEPSRWTRSLPATSNPVSGVLAVALFSVTATTFSPTVAVLSATGAIVFALLGILRPRPVSNSRVVAWGAACSIPIVLLSLNPQREGMEFPQAQRVAWATLVLAMGVFGLLGARMGSQLRKAAILFGLASFVLVSLGPVIQHWNSQYGLDVYQIHIEAGRALEAGLNPYTDAVEIADGSAGAEPGATIDGYPYTPVVLGTYAASSIVTDPRIISSIAWTVVVALLAIAAWRRVDFDGRPLGVFFLVASLPIWRIIWIGAWTEPLTLALLVGAFVIWRRNVLIAGILFGLALASKQYLVLLLPLVLLHREDQYSRRLGVAAVAAIATIVPFLILDAPSFFDAVVVTLLRIPFRPDSLSLGGMFNEFGIAFELPRTAWLLIVGAAGVAVGLRSKTPRDLALLSGVVLAVGFVTGLAFLNYWFLVFGLVAISVSGLLGDESAAGGDSRVPAAA